MVRLEIKIDSMMLRAPARLSVAMPQMVFDEGRNLKCLWCLHPAFSDGSIFIEKLGLSELADEGWIVVCPSLSNGFYLNRHVTDTADFLDDELYPYLGRLLQLPKERAMHVCLGISMGAFGALNWGLRRGGYFSRLVLVSGYFDNRLPLDPRLRSQRSSYLLSKAVGPLVDDCFGKGSKPLADADVGALLEAAKSSKAKLPKMEFLCGSGDLMSLAQMQACYQMVVSKGFCASFETVPGEHNAAAWRCCIEKALKESS